MLDHGAWDGDDLIMAWWLARYDVSAKSIHVLNY